MSENSNKILTLYWVPLKKLIIYRKNIKISYAPHLVYYNYFCTILGFFNKYIQMCEHLFYYITLILRAKLTKHVTCDHILRSDWLY